MSFLTGSFLIDAIASALNNGKVGDNPETGSDNMTPVKAILTPRGWKFPYVSSQSMRYWLRAQLRGTPDWTESPVFQEDKIAFTDGDPWNYCDDDLFGYMRAPSKTKDTEKAAKNAARTALATPIDPLDKDAGTLTRTGPFGVNLAKAVAPVRITRDFGVMARQEGFPGIHEHQFYQAHLKAPFGVDLTAAGTFFSSRRAGYANFDKNRVREAETKGAVSTTVRGMTAWRLPVEERARRVSTLIKGLSRLQGGAKQTLHLTDTSPAVLVMAALKDGNQPFQRLFLPDDNGDGMTQFQPRVLEEALRVFGHRSMLSDVYIGWAVGFLPGERPKLDAFLANEKNLYGRKVHVGHPVEMAEAFAQQIELPENASWFA